MVNFVPDKMDLGMLNIPFMKSTRRQDSGRGTSKSPEQLPAEIRDLMTKLGAYNVVFGPVRSMTSRCATATRSFRHLQQSGAYRDRRAADVLKPRRVRRQHWHRHLYLVRNWIPKARSSARSTVRATSR